MDRREEKKEAKRNGGCVTEILLVIEIILFLFVCELFINFFLLFNLCGFFCYPLFFLFFFCLFFFCLLYFALFFVDFGIEPALSFALLFIVICLFIYLFIYLFIFNFFFLPSWIFWVFLCKFNCSWHFFTSSDRVPPGGGCTAPSFRVRVSKGSKLYK